MVLHLAISTGCARNAQVLSESSIPLPQRSDVAGHLGARATQLRTMISLKILGEGTGSAGSTSLVGLML
jgi:hypothetical protein